MSDAVVSFDARASVAPDVLVSELTGESVILNLNSECYFGLDAMGTRMWAVLTAAESIQAAFNDLLAEFDVSEEQLRHDLTEFIGKLSDQGLVEITGA
jgi:hypothetical protein